MTKWYEPRLAWRYTRSGANESFINFISNVSMAGIALGVAVLLIVMSVMNGFEAELRERILSVASHATITGTDKRLPTWQSLDATASAHPEVVSTAPYIEGQGILLNGQQLSGVMVRGIDPDREQLVSELPVLKNTTSTLQSRAYKIVLGESLAKALSVAIGDKVLLMISEANVTPVGVMPRMRQFTVADTFQLGMHEFDRNLAFMHISDAARLYRFRDDVSGIRLKVADMNRAPVVVREVAQQAGGLLYINNWTATHANFFKAIRLTKSVMFFILLLVVAVAAFNIVSTLVMVVKEKQSDIAILRTLGSTPRSMLVVFITQGAIIGALGTLIGVGLGVLGSMNVERMVHWLERVLGFELLPASVYFIDDLPARVLPQDVLLVGGMAFALAVLSTIYPALRGARTQPAEALRHD